MSISRFHTNCLAAAAVLLCSLGAFTSPALAAASPQPAAKAPAAEHGGATTSGGAVDNVFSVPEPNSTWFAHVDIYNGTDGWMVLKSWDDSTGTVFHHDIDPIRMIKPGETKSVKIMNARIGHYPEMHLHYDVVNPKDMAEVWSKVTATVNTYVTIVPREWEAYVEGKVDSGAAYYASCKYDGGDPTDNPQGVGGTVNFGPFHTGDKQQMRCYRP